MLAGSRGTGKSPVGEGYRESETSWPLLQQEVMNCTQCPRLVAHRTTVARLKRRQYQGWTYWGRPVPGFGDLRARLLIVGLAPAAHGGNRTGRIFTGDRSGDWLYEALHHYGFASQPHSISRDDGLSLSDCYITAVVRCAPPENKPLPEEFEMCRGYLRDELRLLTAVRVVIVLGRLAFDHYLRARRELRMAMPSRAPRFGHGTVELFPDGTILLGSYHPSQQNTFTGKLTRPMFHQVFRRARLLLGPDSEPRGR